MLKGFVSGEEKDVKRITMGTKQLYDDRRTETKAWVLKTDKFIIGCYGNNKLTTSSNIVSYSISENQITIASGSGGCGIGVIVKIESDKTYTLSFDTSKEVTGDSTYFGFNLISESGSLGTYVAPPATKVYTFNSGSAKYAYFVFRVAPQFGEITYSNIMLNLGSTPLPYEPYGYQEGWEVRDNVDRLIWGREDELQTSTGTLPFKGYSLPLKVKSLLGNAVQNGTPAPDNIIIPEMCGVRTGNLVFVSPDNETHYSNYDQYTISDGTITVTGRMLIGFKVKITPDTAYTVSAVHKVGTLMRIREYTEIPNDWTDGFIKQPVNTDLESATFITSSEAEWILVVFYSENVGQTVRSIMLNLGSTALPYEPYGWKVPFENHGENLIVFPYYSQSGVYSGVQFTVSDDGKITANGTTAGGTNFFVSRPIDLEIGTYTISISGKHSGMTLLIYDSTNSRVIAGVGSATSERTFEIDDSNLDIRIYFNAGSASSIDIDCYIMLTPGSSPIPYSPYLNETIPVYLGEVPTVRRVKKLVLDGTEEWKTYGQVSNTYRVSINDAQSIGNPALCSHFENTPISTISSGKFTVGSTWIYIRYADVTDVTDFKAYLASEYAAGHPVTIWYVLANEETAISNEPLAKIGTYADELTTVQVHGLSAPLYGIGDYKDTLNLSTGVVTRKVKKLVLTGTENIEIKSGNAKWYIPIADMKTPANFAVIDWYCSHYQAVSNSATWTSYDYMISWSTADSGLSIGLRIRDIDFLTSTTVADFKAYLAAQYQAGTPVTIWYVLNTPETETVTVPTGMTGEIEGYLTQVSTPTPTNRSVPKWNGVEETGGTYAVTVYTPPEIPTTTGQNTLTVDTTLAPSSLTVKGHIKELT